MPDGNGHDACALRLRKTLEQGINRGNGRIVLSLAICKQLVKRMHGQIGLESELGVGTTCTIELPLEISQDLTTEEKPHQDMAAFSILVIEDHDLPYEVDSLLIDAGFPIHKTTAGNNISKAIDHAGGTSALILIKATHIDPDLIARIKTMRADARLSNTLILLCVAIGIPGDG